MGNADSPYSGIVTGVETIPADISNPITGDILVYDGSSAFANKAMSGDGTIDLDGLLTIISSISRIADEETLLNKTLTSPIINTPVINGGTQSSPVITTPTINTPTINTPTLDDPVLTGDISGDAFLDEDDMASDSAVKVVSQQSLVEFIRVNSRGSLDQNPFINSVMEIDQRNSGATVVGVTSGEYVIDRFQHKHVGAMAYNAGQSADVPNSRYRHSLKTTITDVGVDPAAAGDYMFITQIIEGYNFFPYVGQDATFHTWVKTTLEGIYSVAFRNAGPNRSWVKEITLPADTWTKISFPLTFDYSGGTWDYINGRGLNVSIALVSGSTFHAPGLESWQSNNYFASSNQVNFAKALHSFYMTDFRMNEGLIELPPQFVDIRKELGDCQRYYEKSFNFNQAPVDSLTDGNILGNGFNITTSQNHSPIINFKVNKKDTNLSITFYRARSGANANTWSIQTSSGFVEGAVTMTPIEITERGFAARTSKSSSFILGEGGQVIGHWTISNEL